MLTTPPSGSFPSPQTLPVATQLPTVEQWLLVQVAADTVPEPQHSALVEHTFARTVQPATGWHADAPVPRSTHVREQQPLALPLQGLPSSTHPDAAGSQRPTPPLVALHTLLQQSLLARQTSPFA